MNDELSEFLIAGIIGLSGWFFGGLDGFFKVLLACAAADYITGIFRGGSEGKISSKIAFEGIKRKVTMFFFVGLANIIDKEMLNNSAALKTAVCLFYIGNEGISIVENAEKLGLPIPKFLRGKFLNFAEEQKSQAQSKTS